MKKILHKQESKANEGEVIVTTEDNNDNQFIPRYAQNIPDFFIKANDKMIESVRENRKFV